MTGVLVNAYDPKVDVFLFHMRGKDISTPFGFQAAVAGFGDFGVHPYDVAKNELKTESGVSTSNSTLEKTLIVLPFMKGAYPQPLFVYGFDFDSENSKRDLPILSDYNEVIHFEAKTKANIKSGAKLQEAYSFLVPSNKVNSFVEAIYQRDTLQKGKNGGFFGPIKESHERFYEVLNK